MAVTAGSGSDQKKSRKGLIGLTAVWLGLPLFGKPLAVLSLFLLPLVRDKGGPRLRTLRMYLWLSLTYGSYICLRSLAAGERAADPILDTLTVMLVPALAFWMIRRPEQLDLSMMYRAVVVLLFLVFLATLVEHQIVGNRRPELLLGNPFNLAPLLLAPVVIATMDLLAPGRLWVWSGLVAAMLGMFVLGGLVQTRGIFAGAVLMWLLRTAFVLFEARPVKTRIWPAFRLMLPLFLAGILVVTSNDAYSRYKSLVAIISTPEASIEWSAGLRFQMLEAGAHAIQERPFLGHGPQHRFDAAFPDPDAFPKRFSHLHNDFVTHWVGGGIPAVLLLSALLAAPAIAGWSGNAGLSHDRIMLRRGFGTLATCSLVITAAANNVFFTDISGFSTSLTIVWALIFLEALKYCEFSKKHTT